MIKPRLDYILFIAVTFFTLAGCADAETQSGRVSKGETKIERDVSITPAVSYSDLFLDSLTLEKFISEQNIEGDKANFLRNFYSSRNYQYAWFAEDGFDEHGRAFWNLHKNYLGYSQDSSLFNQTLHQQIESLVNETEVTYNKETVEKLELGLSEHFYTYAHFAFSGKTDPEDLKWHIPKKKINAIGLLDSLIRLNGEKLDKWEPLNQQYKAMRTELVRYYNMEKKGGWPQIEGEQNVYKFGDTAKAIQAIKERLRMTGDYASQDNTGIFTLQLEEAVTKAQQRFGLKPDGAVGPNTLNEFNRPVKERIQQMLINMERMRWMPAHGEGTRLVANIPDYKMHVYEGEKEIFNMRIVVGKAANKTVVFNDMLKHVVFSPYWNVPRSIVRNEILPEMRSNPSYLQQKNMEQTGTRGGLPVIRQKPGGDNALGRVKFLFPNSYAIYFHDTPAKSLFEQNSRAFSHGCIRLAEPKRLAEYLLQGNPGWDESRITDAMYAGTEKWVNLPAPIPVAITYFTSWVDADGRVQFRNDIYGHDKALAAKLFE